MELTKRQAEILDFIKAHISKAGFPPTVREICAHFGFTSPASAKQHIDALKAKGYIKKSPFKGRGIEIIGAIAPQINKSIMKVPIVGRIRAGTPILAAEEIEEYISIDRNIFRNESGFGLRVVGESMIDAGILEGDIVFISTDTEVNNGDIVAAMIDDCATLKRFFRDGDIVRLVPENIDMSAIILPIKDVKIIGRVMVVMRKL
ncbi:MAG: repressor LexA [Nitrospirae bacterium]|nr:repressor LexA [Nitrospirota bacterium]